MFASSGNDGRIKLWTVGEKGLVPEGRVFFGTREVFVAFSPDSKSLAAGSWEGRLELWSIESGTARKFVGHTGELGCGLFS